MTSKLTTFKSFLSKGFSWNPRLMPYLFDVPASWFAGKESGQALIAFVVRARPFTERDIGGAKALKEMLVKVDPWKSKAA